MCYEEVSLAFWGGGGGGEKGRFKTLYKMECSSYVYAKVNIEIFKKVKASSWHNEIMPVFSLVIISIFITFSWDHVFQQILLRFASLINSHRTFLLRWLIKNVFAIILKGRSLRESEGEWNDFFFLFRKMQLIWNW